MYHKNIQYKVVCNSEKLEIICISASREITQLCYIDTIEYYPAIKMKLICVQQKGLRDELLG